MIGFNVGLSVLMAPTTYMTMCSCFGYPLQQRCCQRCFQMNLIASPPVATTAVVVPSIVTTPAIVPTAVPAASFSFSSHTSRICTPTPPVQRPSCSYRRSSVTYKRR